MRTSGLDAATSVPSMAAYLSKLAELFLELQATGRGHDAYTLNEAAQRAVDMILALQAPQKVMLIGNGGSAAIVDHMKNDLCKSVGVRAMVFTDISLLTAVGNDHGYPHVFEFPVELWADAGDVLVAVSSSGQSENILRAAKVAVNKGCRVITLTGFKTHNPLRQLGDVNFYVASDSYGYVETIHAIITHILTDSAMLMRQRTTA